MCASADVVRKIMIKAANLHFDNGEYVFINIDLFSRFFSLYYFIFSSVVVHASVVICLCILFGCRRM